MNEQSLSDIIGAQTTLIREDIGRLREIAEKQTARAEEAEMELTLAEIRIEELESQLKER